MNLMDKINAGWYLLISQTVHRIYLNHLGSRSKIINSLKLEGGKNITIGNKVIVESFSWLAALPLTDLNSGCELKIEDDSAIGHFAHIYATKSIIIGRSVLIADKVYISDNLHAFENIETPIINQPIKQINSVRIGDGAWIGEHVSIIGASVGKNSVIGANSVVTKDIPDYCVAVGAPAKIIKRYNFATSQWLRTDATGEFT